MIMKRILIVEDEKRMRQIYARLLKDLGFNVLEASGAQEVIPILLSEFIDLVLLDINIPVFGGQEIFDALREYDPKLKVIVCSVYSVDKQKSVVPKADDYFDKSQESSILLDKIYRALSLTREVHSAAR